MMPSAASDTVTDSQVWRSERTEDREKFADESVQPRQADAGQREEDEEERHDRHRLARPESLLMSRVW